MTVGILELSFRRYLTFCEHVLCNLDLSFLLLLFPLFLHRSIFTLHTSSTASQNLVLHSSISSRNLWPSLPCWKRSPQADDLQMFSTAQDWLTLYRTEIPITCISSFNGTRCKTRITFIYVTFIPVYTNIELFVLLRVREPHCSFLL